MDLHGRHALVTGGAMGIGEAVAARLAAGGAEVLIADVDEAAGRETAGRLGAAFTVADLATLDGVRAMMAAAHRTSTATWTCWSTTPAGCAARTVSDRRIQVSAAKAEARAACVLGTQAGRQRRQREAGPAAATGSVCSISTRAG